MPADFNINLAKSLTSSDEERNRFYNGMLIYLVCCAALMVLAAYFCSLNIKSFWNNRAEQQRLITTTAAVYGMNEDVFKNPQKAYADLEIYSLRINSLKRQLGQRIQLLPIIYNLFLELPEDVALQSLSANTSKLSFGLVMPVPSEQVDAVKELRGAWETNKELMQRVATIRPLTGERRTDGDKSVFYVQFECVLKK